MVPLRGLQLLCCAAVAGIGLHALSGASRPDDAARLAVNAFDLARQAESSVDAALEAAASSLSMTRIVVQRNDTLDQIFRRLELSLTDLANIRALEATRSALDRLRPGDQLTFARRGEELVGLERTISLSQTLKVQRAEDNSFVASVEEVPLTRHVVATRGSIDSSLFAAGTAAGLRDVTTLQLSEIFRWDVDFVLDLRNGDSFQLIYEQLERDGKIVADGDILAAEFINEGKRFRAVRYVNPAGKADFYTPEGVSLRKAFLKAPVQFSRISSVFNPNRRHPLLNTIRAHRGVDYAAPTGTPVRAAGAGRIQFRGVKGGFGNVVEVEHSGHVVTRYGHLSRFAQNMGAGRKVEQGEIIGYVGMTGLATGPHLHFEYIERGQFVDPQKAIRRGEPGPPVPASERDRFALQTAPLLAQLGAPAATSPALVAR
ncbi:MAG TPA: M23 family metallopeptidase [Steroidobacteraceae bacterium]|nr:M23 family metallopeptidase [Steroidobacteraceae bacterium]